MELAFSNFTIPILEDTQYGGGGLEALDYIIAAEKQSGEMAAIGVAQAAGGVVVFGEEKRGKGAVGRVVAEKLIHGAQEALQLIKSDGALAAQIGLQVGHQESGGDSFPGDVADDEAEALLAEIEEVVVIAADFAGLDADAGVFEGLERRLGLREEAGLDLFGDFDFLGGAAFGLLFLGDGAAVGFDGVGHFVETDEAERIAVNIAEAGGNAAPDRRFFSEQNRWRGRGRDLRLGIVLDAPEAGGVLKADATPGPFLKLGGEVFSDKHNLGGAADEFVFLRLGLGNDERKDGTAIGRSDGDPAVTGLKAGIESKMKSELIEVKAQAAILIANVHVHTVKTEVETRSGR